MPQSGNQHWHLTKYLKQQLHLYRTYKLVVFLYYFITTRVPFCSPWKLHLYQIVIPLESRVLNNMVFFFKYETCFTYPSLLTTASNIYSTTTTTKNPSNILILIIAIPLILKEVSILPIKTSPLTSVSFIKKPVLIRINYVTYNQNKKNHPRLVWSHCKKLQNVLYHCNYFLATFTWPERVCWLFTLVICNCLILVLQLVTDNYDVMSLSFTIYTCKIYSCF